jgi:hypothetical protein
MATFAEIFVSAFEEHRRGNLHVAEQLYRQLLRGQPQHADAHHLLGVLAHQRGRYGDAVTLIRHAVSLNPAGAIYYSNLGMAHAALNQLAEAVDCYRQALQLNLEVAEVHANLAIVLFRQGSFDESAIHYQHALRLQPGFAKAHNDLAILWLLRGDFQHGWPEYEWRWLQAGVSRPHADRPQWDGSDLAGKTILIHGEQGLGDTLQFVRYAPMVKERGGTVVLECQPALVRLLNSAPGIEYVVAGGAPLPDYHVQAPLLSLPLIFHTSLDTIPATVPYLHADADLAEQWRQRIGPPRRLGGRCLQVGIAWQGCPTFRFDSQRSIALKHFARLAQVEGIKLVSVQKGPGIDQLQELEGQIPIVNLGQHFDESSGPFMDTAAIMANVDLVISSDTAVPHLAGALGVPVWVALPYVPDWRWLLERVDSPWYPTMRLFRQKQAGNWDEVFDRIADALSVY